MENEVFKKAFLEVKKEVKELVKIKDRRTATYKHKFAVAKQEFLFEVKESAEKWFDKRVKKL